MAIANSLIPSFFFLTDASDEEVDQEPEYWYRYDDCLAGHIYDERGEWVRDAEVVLRTA